MGGGRGVSRGVTCASSTQKERGERVMQNYSLVDGLLLVARLLGELALRLGFVLLLVANSKRINLTV